MIKRKVIQIGKFTKVVSLPRNWTKKNNVEKGDEINIEERNDELIISFNDIKKRTLVADLDLSELKEDIVVPLLNILHKEGFHEISLKLNESVPFDMVANKINTQLLGFEIIGHSQNKCLIKNILSSSDSELDELLKKSFLVTISLANNSLSCIRKGDCNSLKKMIQLEETNNKLTNLCERVLNESKMDIKNRHLYFTAWLLESIADDYRDLCDILAESDLTKIRPDVIMAYQKVNQLLQIYFHLFYSFSFREMAYFIHARKALLKRLHDMFSESVVDNKIITYFIILCKRMSDSVGAILSLKAPLKALEK